MHSRRKFIGQVATSIAGTLAGGGVLGANDRIRLGLIGAGDRGMQLVREAVTLPNAEVVAFADIYTKRLEEAKKTVQLPKYEQWQRYTEWFPENVEGMYRYLSRQRK